MPKNFKNSRYLDTGSGIGRYKFPALVRCVRCGQANEIVNSERFVCTHCNFTLINQHKSNDWSHWVGELSLYASQGCHHCGTQVFAKRIIIDKAKNQQSSALSAICPQCGFHNQLPLMITPIRFAKDGRDYYFGLPLLLAVDSPMGRMWAFNHEHLQALKAYLQADLRERHALAGNGSMISRLPLWIKLAKNRDKLLKLTDKMEKIYQDFSKQNHSTPN